MTKVEELQAAIEAAQAALDKKQAELLASQEETKSAVNGLKQVITDLKSQLGDGATTAQLQGLIDKATAIVTDIEGTAVDETIDPNT